MRKLLATDDSPQSQAVLQLRQSLIDEGIQVVTIGPESVEVVSSGDLPKSLESVGGDSENATFILNGTPLTCVQVALGSDLVGAIDLVVTGTGCASNVSRRDRDSGLAAAAAQAAHIGRPALSVSIAGNGQNEIQWTAVCVADIVSWMSVSPPPTRGFLNLKVPFGLRRHGLKLVERDNEIESGGDHICVTPIELEIASTSTRNPLLSWAEEIIAVINPRLGVSAGRCLEGCCGRRVRYCQTGTSNCLSPNRLIDAY